LLSFIPDSFWFSINIFVLRSAFLAHDSTGLTLYLHFPFDVTLKVNWTDDFSKLSKFFLFKAPGLYCGTSPVLLVDATFYLHIVIVTTSPVLVPRQLPVWGKHFKLLVHQKQVCGWAVWASPGKLLC